MADEENGNTPDDDISWEDAFAEAAQGHEQNVEIGPDLTAGSDDGEPIMEPQAYGATGVDTIPEGAIDIDFLLDVSLNVTVEVGRRKMLINELLQLQQGSVIDLEKVVGEPFEVYVNSKLMAFGEIVVVNEKFGIRLTDVIDPRERIEKLG